MTWRRVMLGVVLIAAVSIAGLWAWGKPRTHIAMPTAQASPVDVVRTYVRALNDRDFSASSQMGVDSSDVVGGGWYTVHAPNMENVRIDQVHAVLPGSQAAEHFFNSRLRGWEETVEVDTTVTLNNVNGFHASEADQPWSYELVRHDSSKPWRIIDQGQG